MIEIRAADTRDLEHLGDHAKEFYAASRFLRGFDLGRFVEFWTGLIESGTGAVFLLEIDGAIRGCIGGVVYPEPYNGQIIATEFFWFVSAAYRGQGLRLYREFEAWARRLGAGQIRMVHLQDSMPERLEAVYRRLGYLPAETHYVKELNR